MQPLKIVSVILGLLLALAGATAVASGGFVLGVYRSHAAPAGFFMTPSQTVGSNGFALTAPDINDQLESEWAGWALSRARATLRVTGASKMASSVFIGIGPTALVTEYLSGVARDRIIGIDLTAGAVHYDHVEGATRPAPPEEQAFWAAKVVGDGSQTLEWLLQEGDWAVVVMNGDASAPVVADMRLGARFGIIVPLIAGMTVGGALLLVAGVSLIVASRRLASRRAGQPRARGAGSF